MEVAQVLLEAHQVLHHPLQVMIFSNEEGRCIGSKAVFEGLSQQVLRSITNQGGKVTSRRNRIYRGNPARLGPAKYASGDIAGYLELHIEQGPVL